jgi:hypothetical protein
LGQLTDASVAVEFAGVFGSAKMRHLPRDSASIIEPPCGWSAGDPVNSPTATHEFGATHATEFSLFDEDFVLGEGILSQRLPESLTIDVDVLTST